MSDAVGGHTVRLGAIDDHRLLLRGVAATMETVDDIELVATSGSVAGLLSTGATFDVVLLDLRLADGSTPVENVASLVRRGVGVLVHTLTELPSAARAATRAGAHGILERDVDEATLVDAIRTVARGETVVSSNLAGVLESDSGLRAKLSVREIQTLRLYASGMPAKSVARRMGISSGTVATNIKRIKAKYEATGRPAWTRMDLFRRAVEDGIIEPDAGGRAV
ncbi:MAG TPA: response regulator transcription factor [Actinopolymorphaceae bacterium]